MKARLFLLAVIVFFSVYPPRTTVAQPQKATDPERKKADSIMKRMQADSSSHLADFADSQRMATDVKLLELDSLTLILRNSTPQKKKPNEY